jgi:SOS-response transcriptional repressor LexA
MLPGTISALLTSRQAEVFEFVRASLRPNGVSSTRDDIRTNFGLSSLDSARQNVRFIQNKGYQKLKSRRSNATRIAHSLGRQNTDVKRVPVLRRIPAWSTSPAFEEIDDVLPPARERFRGERLFALCARGKGAVAAGIFNDDFPDRRLADRSIAALVNDRAAFTRIFVSLSRQASVHIAGISVGLVRVI